LILCLSYLRCLDVIYSVNQYEQWTPERNAVDHTHARASSEQAWDQSSSSVNFFRKTRTVPSVSDNLTFGVGCLVFVFSGRNSRVLLCCHVLFVGNLWEGERQLGLRDCITVDEIGDCIAFGVVTSSVWWQSSWLDEIGDCIAFGVVTSY
jgi:hypothetical protein